MKNTNYPLESFFFMTCLKSASVETAGHILADCAIIIKKKGVCSLSSL